MVAAMGVFVCITFFYICNMDTRDRIVKDILLCYENRTTKHIIMAQRTADYVLNNNIQLPLAHKDIKALVEKANVA
jgi:hypothetical protein